jgi:hypothetical protein
MKAAPWSPSMAAPTANARGLVTRITDALLGRPIPTDEDEVERVGPLRRVGILRLDALGSAAYGPEALLTALIPLGASGTRYVLPITLVIIGLLVILALSYSQIIKEYPDGGRRRLRHRAHAARRAGVRFDRRSRGRRPE